MSNPSTPVLGRIKNEHFTPGSSPGSEFFDVLQVKYKDYKSAVEAVQQLEIELNEFQSSSYELEKELEKELTGLELKNEELNDKIVELEMKLKKNKELEQEKERKFNDYKDELLKKVERLQIELNEKNLKLIDIEIINDNLEQNERNFKINELEKTDEFNKIFEKNLLLETEVNDLKNLYLNEQLKNQNIMNELNELKELQKINKNNGQRSRNVSISSNHSSLARSNSLLQLHSIRSQSKEMGSKLDNIKNSLNSEKINDLINFNKKTKSNTTTKISNTHITTKTPGSSTSNDELDNKKSRRKFIPSSPNSFTLSSLISVKSKSEKLEVIKGSPNKDPTINDEQVKSRKLSFGGFL